MWLQGPPPSSSPSAGALLLSFRLHVLVQVDSNNQLGRVLWNITVWICDLCRIFFQDEPLLLEMKLVFLFPETRIVFGSAGLLDIDSAVNGCGAEPGTSTLK
mmetsp:Transcript_57672/g.119850  ORF Transcript_57672/g.119850 Transcript_57672/m.119850 type:complete len:102 (-) Transcript_57672:254-559(-)